MLQAAGAQHEAAAALRDALELFERKENIVQAEQTRAQLAALGKPCHRTSTNDALTIRGSRSDRQA